MDPHFENFKTPSNMYNVFQNVLEVLLCYLFIRIVCLRDTLYPLYNEHFESGALIIQCHRSDDILALRGYTGFYRNNANQEKYTFFRKMKAMF